VEQLKGSGRRRGPYQREGDDTLLAEIRAITDARSTYGYRRVTALLNRVRRATGEPPVNRKRVLRLMRRASLTLQPNTARRVIRAHEGTVVAAASNQRWASDGLVIRCWNGEAVHVAFAIDTHDREIMAWVGTASGGINGEMIRDAMLACVEGRFGDIRAPHPIQWLADNGSPYTAKDTIDFATALNLVPCFTPVRSPESNGVYEAFVKTLKRDYARVNLRPDALAVLQQLPACSRTTTPPILIVACVCSYPVSSSPVSHPPQPPVRFDGEHSNTNLIVLAQSCRKLVLAANPTMPAARCFWQHPCA
jgi:putative transposase